MSPHPLWASKPSLDHLSRGDRIRGFSSSRSGTSLVQDLLPGELPPLTVKGQERKGSEREKGGVGS